MSWHSDMSATDIVVACLIIAVILFVLITVPLMVMRDKRLSAECVAKGGVPHHDRGSFLCLSPGAIIK